MFQGFEGPAGTGKTHRLIDAVLRRIEETSIADHQRVLALTFMHASRRRLAERLALVPTLRNRSVCMTIDGFAALIVHRWRFLDLASTIIRRDFDQTCDACGRLLEIEDVAKWVAATFPVILVDEAQELSLERLRLVRALAPHVSLYLAADEFQCLNNEIDTAPFMEWFHSGNVTRLTDVHRTRQGGLLNGARNLRNGMPPRPGMGLTISYKFKNQMPFAIGHALNRAQQSRGTCAFIAAPGGRSWADQIIERLSHGLKTERQRVPALDMQWESRPEAEADGLLAHFDDDEVLDVTNLRERLLAIPAAPLWVPQCVQAIERQLRVRRQTAWSKEQLKDLVQRKAALHRAYGYYRNKGIPVMTIAGAKNRQFEHVVVLWPPGVRGEPDHLRRLLYNAMTRAVVSCTIFVRTEPLLKQPPFAL